MKKYIICYIIILGVFINSCSKDPEPETNEPYQLSFGSFPAPNIPSDNPITTQGVKLGRMLFYEKKFSKDNTMSCASCHLQQYAFSDTSKFSIGVKKLPGKRQAMAVFNMLWNDNEFFWDGRAHLLRDQSLKPIEDELELNETLENVVNKLKADPQYPDQFKKAFGSAEINPELMSKAMEQFMNTIISNKSKYDKYLAGTATLSAEEERGRFLFFTEYNPSFPSASGADCQHCHGGSNFENDDYMNNGLDTDGSFQDKGREEVTKNSSDKAKFKVPSLRNIELTFPYMHDGRFQTLEEVVDHYNLVKNSSTLDGSFQQQIAQGGLKLSDSDKRALVAFLKTLTDYDLVNDSRFSDPF